MISRGASRGGSLQLRGVKGAGRRGRGWWDSVKSFVSNNINPIKEFAKATKIGSTLGSAINPALGQAIASQGYGVRRRRGKHSRR